LVSFLLDVFYSRCPTCPAICKNGDWLGRGHVPPPVPHAVVAGDGCIV